MVDIHMGYMVGRKDGDMLGYVLCSPASAYG
jgi:hypothetical protein